MSLFVLMLTPIVDIIAVWIWSSASAQHNKTVCGVPGLCGTQEMHSHFDSFHFTLSLSISIDITISAATFESNEVK